MTLELLGLEMERVIDPVEEASLPRAGWIAFVKAVWRRLWS